MKLSATCIACMVKRQEENLRNCEDEEKTSRYMREVLKTIDEAPEELSAPVVTERLSALHEREFGTPFSFRELKRKYNAVMMEREGEIAQEISRSEDPLRLAIQYARVGNYIDFGAMGSIEDEKLTELLGRARTDLVEEAELNAFKRDLAGGKRLAYCTDNCGEIVLDKLLIQEIQRQYPGLEITVLVRGKEVLNDATAEDAREVGLTQAAKVLGNGTQVAGTDVPSLCPEAREALLGADVILSKGQGNFETLHGCGLNVYYLFLCKCDWFTRRFGLERFQGVFVNERNHRIA